MNNYIMRTPLHGCGKRIGLFKCGNWVDKNQWEGKIVYCKDCSSKTKQPKPTGWDVKNNCRRELTKEEISQTK